MSFEERLGHIYIYVYRLDRDLSWARAKLTNNACVTRLFIHIFTYI